MSAICDSIERFREKDEPSEFAKLSEQEKNEILDDMYGRRTKNNNADDDDITEELLDKYFDEIISIPNEKKENYMFAMDYYPHLVRYESHPKVFLRSTEYNPILAAKKQVDYWDMRVKIFGSHAFDRIVTSLEENENGNGGGAMKDVIQHIVKIPNFFRILPDDTHGRTVICWDEKNVKWKEYDDIIIVKIIWFVAHVALQRRSTQVNGIVFTVIDRDANWDFPSYHLMKLAVNSISKCLPWKICCLHICISSLAAAVVLPIARFFVSRDDRLRFLLHNSIKTPTVLSELESFGLLRDNLPKSIGGNYNEKPTWIVVCERILKKQQPRCMHRNKRQRITSHSA